VQIERIQEEKLEFHPKITLNMIKKPETPKYVIPQLGLVETDVLGKEDLDQILRYGEQHSDDPIQNAIYENMRAYKQEIFEQANDAYNAGIQNGDVKPNDYRRFYDHAVLEMYETCIKPLLVETLVDGRKKKVTVPIGELIAPYDDSFGAQVAREATRLIGLEYKAAAGQGKQANLKIDCSGLVRWVLFEINSDWGELGIRRGARYQIQDSESRWSDGDEKSLSKEKLVAGDTLFWRGDDTKKIVHTSIYIGKLNDVDLMIEAGDYVRIVPLRFSTSNRNGESSTLFQVNRMSPERLKENVDNYKNK
jgi:hypothetical protein